MINNPNQKTAQDQNADQNAGTYARASARSSDAPILTAALPRWSGSCAGGRASLARSSQ